MNRHADLEPASAPSTVAMASIEGAANLGRVAQRRLALTAEVSRCRSTRAVRAVLDQRLSAGTRPTAQRIEIDAVSDGRVPVSGFPFRALPDRNNT